MIDGCDLLGVDRHTSVFCHKVSENVGGVYEAFNPPILYQMEMITGDPDVAFFGGLALFCTTWPVAAAHVCVPLAIGFLYEWWTQVSAVW